jgi:GTPase SAR1 family protein
MWVEEIKQFAEEGILKLLIGNKKDLSQIREVTTDEALAYAEKNNMAFFEASALDGSNVTKAFDHIINEVFRLSQNIPDKCQ